MHFSRPSGQRLSWWWPWNRGAVCRFSSGYCTVSTFRNISRKVTPNPFTGLRKSSTGDLLSHAVGVAVGRAGQRSGAKLEAVVIRQDARRRRVTPARHGGAGGLGHLDQLALIVVVPLVSHVPLGTRLVRLQPLEPLGVAVVPEGDQR